MADPHSVRAESLEGDPEFANLLEELTDRLQSQQSVNFDEYHNRYPQYAEQLGELVPALQTLVGLGQSSSEREDDRDPSLSPTTSPCPQRRLGDFQILREIGRGGMGVVYEAEQISLRRRVALKILPFAGILDEQTLTRFKNEALAAASLDHPHIVNVLFVGCDRGVHYYAMRLVDGQTLGEMIAQQKTLAHAHSNDVLPANDRNKDQSGRSDDVVGTECNAAEKPGTGDTCRELQASASTVRVREISGYFRTVANLGIQAAQALDHAHANGILHRDIKPGNLLIDGQGKLWVTDFGLARIEANATMTITGDVLGTPSTLKALNSLGNSLARLGEWTAARRCYEQVVMLRQETLGDSHPDTIGARSNVAVMLMDQGQFDESREILEEILEIQVESLGEEYPDTLDSMSNLGLVLEQQGHHEQARVQLEKVLQMRSRLFGSDAPQTLSSMNNMANVLSSQGKYEEATDLYEQCVEFEGRRLGREHPRTLNAMHNLANVFRDQQKLDEARQLHQQVLTTRRDVIGTDHPDTLKSILCLARVLREQEEYGAAADLLNPGIEASRRKLGENHYLTLSVIGEMARIRLNQHQLPSALKLARDAVDRDDRGLQHASTLSKQDTLAEILEGLDEWAEAREVRERIVESSRLQEHSPADRARWIRNLALLLASAPIAEPDDHKLAVVLATEACELDPDNAGSWQVLGAVQAISGAWRESRVALERVVELGLRADLLPQAIIQQVDQSHNRENVHFQELMTFVRQHKPHS